MYPNLYSKAGCSLQSKSTRPCLFSTGCLEEGLISPEIHNIFLIAWLLGYTASVLLFCKMHRLRIFKFCSFLLSNSTYKSFLFSYILLNAVRRSQVMPSMLCLEISQLNIQWHHL